MNRNPKEKTSQILIRLKLKDKERIKSIAKKCGLTQSEYVLQRALGYRPKAVNPDAFYHFYGKLCELLNQELSPETEEAALKLFDKIHAELLYNKRQSVAEIRKEIQSGSPKSQRLFGEKEHPRNGELSTLATEAINGV